MSVRIVTLSKIFYRMNMAQPSEMFDKDFVGLHYDMSFITARFSR